MTTAGSSSALRASLAGRFAVGELAGKGGMGEVYAGHAADGTRVAIKRVAAATVADVSRFVHEAEALERLAHPHVVRYVEHGVTASGDHYLVTEWIEGQSLAQRLHAGGPLAIHDALALARGVAGALVVAHAADLIHRDLKPSNLMLPDGRADQVKVIDFGIARAMGEGGGVTATGEIVGTPGFLAPEQARGVRTLDGRADLFGLGTILYEAITGKAAFAADDLMTTLALVLMHTPPPIDALRDRVPPRLVALIDRLLAKEPADRPATAAEVIAELDAIGRGEPAPPPVPKAKEAPTVRERPPGRRQRRWIGIAAGAVLLAGAAVAIAVVGSGSRDNASASEDARAIDAEPAPLGPPCTKDDLSGCLASCDANNRDACYLLGDATVYGKHGQPKDRVAGIDLLSRACELGHGESCLLGNLNRELAGRAGELPDGWQKAYFSQLERACGGKVTSKACVMLARAMMERRIPGIPSNKAQHIDALLELGCRMDDREACAMIKLVPKDDGPPIPSVYADARDQ